MFILVPVHACPRRLKSDFLSIIGGYYSDGKLADKPFYAFRAGLDIPLLPILHLDINANYRFENWDDLSAEGKSVDADTITLGAAARLAF